MISVQDLIYEFKLNMNKINRQDNVDIPVEDIIVYLNKAQMSWVKTKINQNNVNRAGFDSIRKRIDDLQVLKVSNAPLSPQKTNDLRYTGYRCPLDQASDYMFYVQSYSVGSKNKCKGQTLTNDLIRSGELDTKYKNDNYNPSFEWRYCLATLGNDQLEVYTDGTFELQEVYLTYLRYPKTIDAEGYTKFDGTSSTNQNSELPEYAKSDLVDLAVKFAAMSNDNQSQVLYAEDRLVKNTE